MPVRGSPNRTVDIFYKSDSHIHGLFNRWWDEANKVESCVLEEVYNIFQTSPPVFKRDFFGGISR